MAMPKRSLIMLLVALFMPMPLTAQAAATSCTADADGNYVSARITVSAGNSVVVYVDGVRSKIYYSGTWVHEVPGNSIEVYYRGVQICTASFDGYAVVSNSDQAQTKTCTAYVDFNGAAYITVTKLPTGTALYARDVNGNTVTMKTTGSYQFKVDDVVTVVDNRGVKICSAVAAKSPTG